MDILNPMGLEVRCKKINGEDYFSMRDLAEVRVREGKKIKDIGRTFCRNEANFRMILAIEKTLNPDFNVVHMNDFTEGKKIHDISTPTKLTEKLGLTCMVVERGKKGNVWIYHTLGVAFAMWINAEFGAYLLTDYERMKHKALLARPLDDEDWKEIRHKASVACTMLTDTIRNVMYTEKNFDKKYFKECCKRELNMINTIVMGMTAKEWKEANPDKEGNMRDHATKKQNAMIYALQVYDAFLIQHGSLDMVYREDILRNRAKSKHWLDNSIRVKDLNRIFCSEEDSELKKKLIDSFMDKYTAGEIHQDESGYWVDNEGFKVLAPRLD